MDNFHYSNHATVRCQQRGITAELVELLLRFGDKQWMRGSHSYSLNRKTVPAVRAFVGERAYRKIERKLKMTYVVVSPEGTLVTAAIRHRRVRQN